MTRRPLAGRQGAEDDVEDDLRNQQQDQYQERPRQRLRLSKNATSAAAGANASAARCKVCGASTHSSGFGPDGVYRDCTRRPCYLCREPGHVARQCPHRPRVAETATTTTTTTTTTTLPALLLDRRPSLGCATTTGAIAAAATAAAGRARWSAEQGAWRVSAACLDLHEGRVTCLAFPGAGGGGASSASSPLLLASGDRHGGVAIWNFSSDSDQGPQSRTYYPPGGIFRSLVNCLAFPAAAAGEMPPGCGALPGIGAAGDGTVRLFDLETGARRTLLELRPNGSGPNARGMVYWVAPVPALGCFLASDNRGSVHLLDARCGGGQAAVAATAQVHGRAAKVNAVAVADVGLAGGYLAATGANDHAAKLLDLRRLGEGAGSSTLATLPHGGVVTHAAFCGPGPVRRGLVTTCHDNRLRVWDDVARLSAIDGGGDGAAAAGPPPSRVIVHSHNFSRHLPAFRAVPDPKLPAFAVVGRYLSEVAPAGAGAGEAAAAPVHPVDVVDLSTGRLVAALSDPERLLHVPAVNAAHPDHDLVASGASRSVYVWGRRRGGEEEQGGGRSVRAAGAASASARRKAKGA